jgi:ATP-dependent helicase Lhr and Lhr-like helicase
MTATFHPAVEAWFASTLGAPTAPQADGWPAIQARRHTLIAAPTGSGKTLAAFLCAIDELVRVGAALKDELYVVYVSPLKALSHDIDKNLAAPIAGIARVLEERGEPSVPIRTWVRTGDTPAHERTAATKRPPHILVTTPESLYILLTSDGGRRMLKTARTVIVDEIHAVAGNKRGSHLALSLERLDALVTGTGGTLQRIGLSATQRPIEEVARFLVGTRAVHDGRPDCHIVDGGHKRALDLAVEVPSSPLETVMSGEVWEELHARLTELILAHRTTLVFVNTRRMAERLTRSLSERVGEDAITSHHGSLSKKHRLDAERRLKNGELKALVATASLELGIDIGDVDLVCQIGSTRSIAALLQRVGRSGHRLGGTPRGRLFPLSRDDLLECAALVDAVRRGELDRLHVPIGPLDILAQQIVAASAAEGWDEQALFELARGAWPYRDLERGRFDEVVRMLAEGFATARGRRSAHLHHDRVNGKVRGRRGAKIAAITSGGAIPDLADYEVLLEPAGLRVGTLNEDFAIESMAGDIFQLGNVSYRIVRVEPGKVRVEDARGEPPTMPFWLGEAPSRTEELSGALSRLRSEVGARLEGSPDAARAWLEREVGLGEPAARQIADYLATVQNALGVIPTQTTLVLERFFDETGTMHLVVHAPLGSRLNRAWGLALRKCFCRRFNFELQAAADENAIVLSLGPTHSFALEEVWSFLKSATVRDILVQALLDAPMFATRWRWNATRALAVLRFRGGRKVAPQLQRMDADDLLTVCFPDKVACLENVVGNREIPDHPLVVQTIGDCLTEAMDAEALVELVKRIETGSIAMLARDVREPSPLAAEILNARPYAFLDDAPLEERRTQAVMSRRWLDPSTASDLGALDEAAIARVRQECWPAPRDGEELHDALVLHGGFTEEEARAGAWQALLDGLVADRRVTAAAVGGERRWIAAERLGEWQLVHATLAAAIAALPGTRATSREEALVELVRGRLECEGPTTAARLAATLCVPESDAQEALIALEVEGFVMRGRFTAAASAPGAAEEWCERRLLARVHRYTIARLRREIEPVTAADFMRFLARWQHLGEARLAGPDGVVAAVEQLDGFEVQAGAWETDVLPSRVAEYDPQWLDALCFSGRVAWARRSGTSRKSGPVRTTPLALMRRGTLGTWLAQRAASMSTTSTTSTSTSTSTGEEAERPLSSRAEAALAALQKRGACFFDDLGREAKLLKSELEAALGELVGAGLVSSDGFGGLRALIAPRHRPHPRRRGGAVYTMESAGRWSLMPAAAADQPSGDERACEQIAWTLLRRWGVIFRRLIDREGPLPPWRDLLRALRRLEARGEIRGGRFVDGFAGEQFALIDAVGLLREVRREPARGALVAISAADPLNLVGIVTPGRRVAAIAKSRILLNDGLPIACREGGEIRLLDEVGALDLAGLQRALVQRPVAPAVRAYLGNAV